MTIIVFSDLHGREPFMRAILDKHRHADYVFFLGDGISSAESLMREYEKPCFVGVKGNCDFLSDAPADMTLDIEGKRFFLHHGHTSGVKHGMGGAIAAARLHSADICLFGHTHEPYLSYEQADGYPPLYLFNPGSIAAGSYGVIEVRGGEALLSHGKI